MNIMLLGAAGFIGTNLALELAKNSKNKITLVDVNKDYFVKKIQITFQNIIEFKFEKNSDFESLLKNQDVVYHLVSTVIPSTANKEIGNEINSNVVMTANFLDACVKCEVKKVIFISSGGTVYGKDAGCPLVEDQDLKPISSYGLEKVMIEKLLYLYEYLYKLDYRIVRLSNPYGPYQRPNGMLGALTTFTYKALNNEKITIFGDGSVVRDFIYIDDAVKGIVNIANIENTYKIFNLGSGSGKSIKSIMNSIENALQVSLDVEYIEGRKSDVPVNYLDVSRYEKIFGKCEKTEIVAGVIKTAQFMKDEYDI